jgi:hypothetical protein
MVTSIFVYFSFLKEWNVYHNFKNNGVENLWIMDFLVAYTLLQLARMLYDKYEIIW